MIPGEYFIRPGHINANEGRDTATVTVVNTGDRPVQIGSHTHFFEVNRMLSFDRKTAFGKRLNIMAGTAVRFEPGEEKTVELVNLGGARNAYGMNNLVNGNTTSTLSATQAMKKISDGNFKNNPS